MEEFISNIAAQITWARVFLSIIVGVVAFAGGIAFVSLVLVRVPADYFHHENEREFMTDKHHFLRWGGVLVKNLIGGLLIVLGVAMIVLPGPGLLTILIGVMLLDIPAKRDLERRIVSRPQVLRAINNLRARYGKSPLVLE